MKSTIFRSLALAAVAFAFTERNAHAYLDPGAGSYATQIIIATIAGAAFSIKSMLLRFRKPVKSVAPQENGSQTTRENR